MQACVFREEVREPRGGERGVPVTFATAFRPTLWRRRGEGREVVKLGGDDGNYEVRRNLLWGM